MESLSSHNSLRFLDVKGRPERSSPSKSETEVARFPDPLADPHTAERSEQAQNLSERSEQAAEDVDSKTDSRRARSSQERSERVQDSEGAPQGIDSDEDEDLYVEVSDGNQEVDPEEVPKGAFGESSDDSPQGMLGLPQSNVAPSPSTPVGELKSEPLLQVPVEGIQGGMPSGAPVEALVAQAPVQKPVMQSPGSMVVDQDSAPQSGKESAPVQLPQGDPSLSQEFGQGQGEAPFGDPLAGTIQASTPSIDALIQDARIEAISLELRPAAPTGPAQPAQAITSPGTMTMGALPMGSSEAILNQIQARIQPSMNRAVLRLSPESLGRVAIELSVEGGEVRAEMRVESAESLQAIQKYIPELKAMFAQADLELSELNLQLDSEGSGFDWEQETPADQQTWVGRNATPETKSEAPSGAESARLSPLEGGLDLIA